MAGIKQSILLSTIAVLIAVVTGAALGMCAGYFRGLVDEVVGRLADALFSFPAVVLAILISAIFRPGAWSAIAAVALVTLPIVTRVVRAATLTVAHRDFIIQARIAGSSDVRTLLVHILPNVARRDCGADRLFRILRHDHRKRHQLRRTRGAAAQTPRLARFCWRAAPIWLWRPGSL